MTFRPGHKPQKPILLSPAKRRALKVKLYNGRANGRCEFCNENVVLNDSYFDVFFHAHLVHIVPRKRGGDTEENCKIGCFTCHRKEHDGR